MRSRIITGIIISIIITASCSEETTGVRIPHAPEDLNLSDAFYYEIDLNDRSDDTFKVRMFVGNLIDANKVFQFPATAPGIYDIADIGRFVTTFKAYDEDYNELGALNTAPNQWTLSEPARTHIIEFEIKETFDTPVTSNSIYLMAGTSIEKDHVLLNAFDVLGYPTGLKERNFYLDINYSSSWKVGTSLLKTPDGLYYADNYDLLVDSPLLLGKLTTASTTVSGANVNVVAYSKTNQIAASQILSDVNQVLLDANEFLNGLPVDRYSFLYFFDNTMGSKGALEHSYSSVYTLTEVPYTANYGQFLRNISAHEFFHIVTPLNIHSEIIEDFNFATPTPSEHLWLYEGVTEWASMLMQYRNESISLSTLLNDFRLKKIASNTFDPNYSLSELALNCYTHEGSLQYNNIYQKGALVAALLDIRLLELSNGEYGLRELILELIDMYGPENAFSEENFFTDIVSITTYPEIDDFIDRYIQGAEALPLENYFNKIGIGFNPTNNTFFELLTKTEQQQFMFNQWRKNL